MPFATSYKVNIQSTRRCNVAFHKHTDDADLFQTASCTDRQSLTSPQYSDMKSFFSQDSFRKMPHPATSDGAINRCCGTQNKINIQTYSCLDIGMPLHCLHSSSLYFTISEMTADWHQLKVSQHIMCTSLWHSPATALGLQYRRRGSCHTPVFTWRPSIPSHRSSSVEYTAGQCHRRTIFVLIPATPEDISFPATTVSIILITVLWSWSA